MKIGIIGGIGAAAGSRMYDALIRECQKRGAEKDSDFPEVVLHNLPTTGTDETGICDSFAVRGQLLNSVCMLNSCGVNVIAIACNTVHLYIDELQAQSKATILNMVDIASERACQNMDGRGNVGVISSSTTRETKLYENAITKRGNKFISITDSQQIKVDNIVSRVISGNANIADGQELFSIYSDLRNKNADVVILGCTELPLAMGKYFRRGIFIDPTDCVISELLK